MNRYYKIVPKFVIIIGLGFCLNTFASLVSLNDAIFGRDSLTLDTSTNLAWLDLSFTVGKSYLQTKSEIETAGMYSGYRYATGEEINHLFESASIPNINVYGDGNGIGTKNNYQSVKNLIHLLGITYERSEGGILLFETGGFSGSTLNDNGRSYVQLSYLVTRDYTYIPNYQFGEAHVNGGGLGYSSPYVGIGSWLVKDYKLPESNTLPLLLLGIFLIYLVKVSRNINALVAKNQWGQTPLIRAKAN